MGFNIQPYGIQSMLKERHKHLSGLDEAVLKSIEASKQLSTITRTSLVPMHPAAKVLVLAGKPEQEEIEDGANLTISFAGQLISFILFYF
ncbi:hypothetical protein VNO78_02549 [Psophocarpus tetragonolobus]|uniref:Uncharacterized protein n=1 Tax=Psophocarpus tetragonolobus TaxID=3891 RepID=A0AAN9T1I3_PSOTE